MECNKEEAIRAKDIAVKRMINKDFAGARKIVLKAQQLYPDIENVSQMLTVCDVHISADVKVNGETDWYGILQVEITADELMIKKHYRKLALLLHPDKNKFAGAEAAFKLIGEANMILSDRGKRCLHDMKRRINCKVAPTKLPQQSNASTFGKKHAVAANVPNTTRVFNGMNQHHNPPSAFPSSQTFWTICPSCKMRYQYYMNILNRPLRCQSCQSLFTAYDVKAQTMPAVSSSGFTYNNCASFGKQPQGCPNQHAPTDPQKSHASRSFANEPLGFQNKHIPNDAQETHARTSSFYVNLGVGSSASGFSPKPTVHSEAGICSTKPDREGAANQEKEQVKSENGQDGINIEEQTVKTSDAGRKRPRKHVLSSGSESSDSEDSVAEGFVSEQHNSGINGGSSLRRSSRQKKNISYTENISDDDTGTASKRIRKRGSSSTAVKDENISDIGGTNTISGDRKHGENKCSASLGGSLFNGSNIPMNEDAMNNKKMKVEEVDFEEGTGSNVKASAAEFSYPETEFYDFEKNKDPSLFAADQIWALYDDLDAMPRFYAKIRQVLLPDFKLRFTWLEYDPVSDSEMEWCNVELPVSCGKYKFGITQHAENLAMFSHLMAWQKGSKKNSFEICPRKGEAWALFKGWNIEWISNAGNHREAYDYEIVEVVSGSAEGSEVIVARLFKIKGFVSVFARSAVDETLTKVPSNEMLRFSHMIPSYRLTGHEGGGVPRGCLELDTASLPQNFSDILPSISLTSIAAESGKLDNKCSGVGSKPASVPGKSSDHPVEVSIELDKINVGAKEKICRNIYRGGRDSLANEDIVDDRPPQEDSPCSYEYPEPEFHNFEINRSCEKFQKDQIWALYNDLVGVPNYYGLIREVQHDDFSVQLAWLEFMPQREEKTCRIDKSLPIGCGKFKVLDPEQSFENTNTFSHLVDIKPGGRKDRYEIYPHKGQIWAVYKNRNVCPTKEELDICEYDLVEVVDDSSSEFRVVLLMKVCGYKAIFRPPDKGASDMLTVVIPIEELWRFSHRIPAYKLTEEKGGKLRGFWELDPAALPIVLLCVD